MTNDEALAAIQQYLDDNSDDLNLKITVQFNQSDIVEVSRISSKKGDVTAGGLTFAEATDSLFTALSATRSSGEA